MGVGGRERERRIKRCPRWRSMYRKSRGMHISRCSELAGAGLFWFICVPSFFCFVRRRSPQAGVHWARDQQGLRHVRAMVLRLRLLYRQMREWLIGSFLLFRERTLVWYFCAPCVMPLSPPTRVVPKVSALFPWIRWSKYSQPVLRVSSCTFRGIGSEWSKWPSFPPHFHPRQQLWPFCPPPGPLPLSIGCLAAAVPPPPGCPKDYESHKVIPTIA